MYKRILCTLDGSELAERALPHALAMAKAFSASLVVLRVVEPPPPPILPDIAAVELQVLPELMTVAREYVEKKVAALAGEGVDVTGAVEEGRAAETIASYAQEHGVDLIVMATHGRSGLSRWAFGSFYAWRLAPCCWCGRGSGSGNSCVQHATPKGREGVSMSGAVLSRGQGVHCLGGRAPLGSQTMSGGIALLAARPLESGHKVPHAGAKD